MDSKPLETIRRGVADIISEDELKQKLASERPLVIKAGFDPTAPDLHFGHTVLLRKLRHFQDLGHRVIFLIGDATGLVGDPSGQSQTRKVLSWEQVRKNASTYQEQVKKLLLTTRDHFEIRYNSEWFLGRSPQLRRDGLEQFDFMKFVELATKTTVARLIERDDFSKRLRDGQPVSFLELFYPLMQGYDSVKIAEQYQYCDIELGGTDQTFNLLMGRELLRAYQREPQVVITMPLLEGTDGVRKMSKSLENHIGIHDAPREMFGKVMSIPDELIVKYFILLTDVEDAWIEGLKQKIETRAINPRDAKAELAGTLVALYHSSEAAKDAHEHFFSVFSRKETPAEMPEVTLRALEGGDVSLIDLLIAEGLAKSRNDARRLLGQGAVKINGVCIKQPRLSVTEVEGVLQVGSRHFRRLTVTVS